ncbi:MAG: 2'-5' RNA ligase family protein [Cyanobacteria bacterium P01_E01_bin.34]
MSKTEPQQLFFLALLPPPDMQASITAIKQEFGDRFNSYHALKSPPHITVFPPFKWPESQKSQFECLADFAAAQEKIPVTLSGFGAFPPRVIYVRPLKSPTLMEAYERLQKFLAARLELVDLMAKRRAFSPHVTVAHRDLSKENFRAAWVEIEERSFDAEFTAIQLTLLQHNGHHWEIAREWEFRGDAN